MSFPSFDGSGLRIWLDKCRDYFRIHKFPPGMWVTAASLHMEDNASRWWQVYRVQNGVVSWENFVEAVQAKFGQNDFRKSLGDLLELSQSRSLEDYIKVFEESRYVVSMHNPELGEMFFVLQFLKGLKVELRVCAISGPRFSG